MQMVMCVERLLITVWVKFGRVEIDYRMFVPVNTKPGRLGPGRNVWTISSGIEYPQLVE